MIGPGWLPSRPISRLKKRTLAYTRLRPRRSKPRGPRRDRLRDDPTVMFQHDTATEFPVATLRPHAPAQHAHAFMGELLRWLTTKWSWLRPRTVPVLVAALGLLAVLESADYLRHVKGTPPHYSQLTK